MEKTIQAAMGKFHEVVLKEVTFTVSGIESSVYVVIKRMNQGNEVLTFDQFHTELKAQRKFARLTHIQ